MTLIQTIRRSLLKLQGRDPDFISVVLLLRKPLVLTRATLEQAIERAWPAADKKKEGDKIVVTMTKLSAMLVKVYGHGFNVVAASRPYIKDPEEVAKRFEDLRTQEAIRQHKAWLAVDYLLSSHPKEKNIDKQYALAAKLASELINEDCFGVCLPGEDVIVGSSPSLSENLRNFDSVSEFTKLVRQVS